MRKLITGLCISLLLLSSGIAFAAVTGAAETGARVEEAPEHAVPLSELQSELFSLKSRVNELEADLRHYDKQPKNSAGLVVFLFGIVCALWAQNTGRNPWLWFFAGVLFNVITALIMLRKNSDDRKQGQ